MQKKSPFVLLILDGFGYRADEHHNAIAKAHTPQWDSWWATRPHLLIEASGHEVGLPNKQMGNSEVGHMHIGAGRLIQQHLSHINTAIDSGTFAQQPTLLNSLSDMQSRGGAMHVMGLISDGGVHSHINHLMAFLALCEQQSFSRVYLHLFLDGRDTPPRSAMPWIKALGKYPFAQISSISGRYYAMDRDKRWTRVLPVYDLLTQGHTPYAFENAETAIESFYTQNITDEFIPPTKIGHSPPIKHGDTVFFFNFRADRARQLTEAFLCEDFNGFERKTRPHLAQFITMTPYASYLPTQVVFPDETPKNTLGEVLANHHLSQLRIAETEKYAHVTFFFNGGVEQTFIGEERCLIPSPTVATYDLKPEMSAEQITQTIVKAIHEQRYDVIICNYANADMVGHTGQFDATVKAIECLDSAMHQIWQALAPLNGQLLITADHGNAERMFDDITGQSHTAHTSQPVPLLYVGHEDWCFREKTGSLKDIAPTVLTLLGIQPPAEMTGRPLLVKEHA